MGRPSSSAAWCTWGLSAAFGLIYCLITARTSETTKRSWGTQAGIGALYGMALWLVNFQIVARIAYPWFLDAPQTAQAMLHALFFGLPLGLAYAGAGRRLRPIRRAPTPA